MKRVLAALTFLLLAISGLADGKVFAHRTAIADATIPDQRALLYWSNGVERLVIETRFAGEGSNFAWVVPVPNPPVVEEASPGLFATLAHQLKPELVHDPAPLFAISNTFTAFAALSSAISPERKRRWCGSFSNFRKTMRYARS